MKALRTFFRHNHVAHVATLVTGFGESVKSAIFPADLHNLLVRLWHHLSRRRRRQFVLLTGLMLLSAVTEVVSLGAVWPFLGILTAPEWVFKHPIIAYAARACGFTSADQLVLPLTVAFAAAALMAGAVRLQVSWASTRLAFASGSDLSLDGYRRTLYQPYGTQMSRNSSEVVSGLTTKVTDVTFQVLLPILMAISATVQIVAIGLALIFLSPVVALGTTVALGGSYALITWPSRRVLHRNSQRYAHEQPQVVKALQEGLGGIRDVLLDGTQQVFCDTFLQADHASRHAQAINVFITSSPRFAMEALGMVVIAALAYGLSRQSGGIAPALPVLGALAFGAQRLLPALQQSYGAWASTVGCHASLVDVVELLDQPMPAETVQPTPLPFQDSIHLNEVRFRYASDGPWVLNGLNLTIFKGSRVGFVGATGSGKSTTLDLLMGLLLPIEGELLVDGKPILGSRVRAWQRTVAHVPQSIYLADTTFAGNIAFGVAREAIDMARVRQAATQAQIADFIESRPDGYRSFVGERGIRLSGGQRQRIGIARALYKQASVLVFDEATSALDNVTEQSVMDSIDALHRDFTILVIAHRLTTVRRCDTIVELEQGRVVAQGTYEQLVDCSPSFRSMAQAVG